MLEEISLPKAYEPQTVEGPLYQKWLDSGYFNPDNSPLVTEKSEAFSIVLPPPNVTGTLHMGHAMMLAIEDAMVRYARMTGKHTLWIPGTDHAAIATQSKVEGIVFKEEGKTRHDLGREEFLRRVRAFAQDSHDTIVNQVKKMGASVDWSREAYTLDAERNKAVNVAFERMFNDGLIYRGYRVVNFDPVGQTTVSDDEVVYKEGVATLYTFKYSKDFPISISTTRPETKVGDTAVAVHPKDERYVQFVGKEYTVDFCGVNLKIKVIADESVDREFGTGALGVTPAHSATDADLARVHKLEMIQVIGEDGRMRDNAGLLKELTTLEARVKAAQWLRDEGLMESEVESAQNLSLAERSGGVIEPLPKMQWFIDVNKEFKFENSKVAPIKGLPLLKKKASLKDLMLKVVENGQIEIIPERFKKTYFHWTQNLRDWNISRQIWFGHQVPVWYCLSCQKPHANLSVKNKWYLVRHGETDWNKQGIIQGYKGLPLNELGREQAQMAADQLKNSDIGLIISSDIGRCKETAEIIAASVGAPVEFDERLRERNFGSLEGVHDSVMRAQYGTLKTFEPVADVELLNDVEKRVAEAFEEHKKNITGKNVVIVSHGGALRMLVKHLRKLTPEQTLARRAIGNAEVLSLDIGEKACECGSDLFEQDQDTLDTWFSSGLWTFSTLGWPNEETFAKMRKFHPTSIIETGYDILPFWVARMILMSTYLLGEVPFKKAYLHGLVRDEQGRKMSKSLGNIIDPLTMIEKYGADATRLSLLIGVTPGNDTKLAEDKIAAFRNFTNKLWNISRFVFMSVDEVKSIEVAPTPKTKADAWILSRLAEVTDVVTKHFEANEYSLLGETLRDFTWTDFADWYLEIAKVQKKRASEDGTTNEVLLYVLENVLKLWHPFMPYVTEALYGELKKGLLIVAPWPKMATVAQDGTLPVVQEVITAIRNLRSQYKVEPKQFVPAYISGADHLASETDLLQALARLETLDFSGRPEGPVATVVVGNINISLPLAGLVDLVAEEKRMLAEAEETKKHIAATEARLSNKEYVNNAPSKVIEGTQNQLKTLQEKLKTLENEIARLKV